MQAISGDDGVPDPLRVPDPFYAENHPILYDMFFRQSDPQKDAAVKNAIMTATGFIRNEEKVGENVPLQFEKYDEQGKFQGGEVVPFDGIDTVEERVAFMVSEGGVALAYPKELHLKERDLNRLTALLTLIPAFSCLFFKNLICIVGSTTDVTIPDPFNTAGDNEDEFVTLVDLPRENYGPEG